MMSFMQYVLLPYILHVPLVSVPAGPLPSTPERITTKFVLHEGLSYSTAFLLSYVFQMIISIRALLKLSSPVALVALSRIFFPLQGFFNFCVFIYPRMRNEKKKVKI